jgi:hypothetical protein
MKEKYLTGKPRPLGRGASLQNTVSPLFTFVEEKTNLPVYESVFAHLQKEVNRDG